MECLGEETKNLAARLGKQGAIDKKVERQIKIDLMEKCRQSHEDFVHSFKQSPARLGDYREAYVNAINLLSLRLCCFLGFSGEQATSEEWAVRIRVNVIKLVGCSQAKQDAMQELLKTLY